MSRFKRLHVEPGMRFGLLCVLKEVPRGTQRRISCLCDCGNTTTAMLNNLTRGHTRSCGCERIKTTIARNLIHGLTKTPEHNVWCGIKRRCYDQSCKSFKDYGARGISIAEEWRNDFSAFLSVVGNRPSSKYTIERTDNDGNYAPGNVVWATRKQQNRNTRASRLLSISGESRCVSEWDEILTAKCGKKPGYFKSAFYRYGLPNTLTRMGLGDIPDCVESEIPS